MGTLRILDPYESSTVKTQVYRHYKCKQASKTDVICLAVTPQNNKSKHLKSHNEIKMHHRQGFLMGGYKL